MILEPGALFDVPYDYDLTGFTIVANGQVFRIGSVEPGTSADRRPGDVIEELDGKAVQGMRLADLQRAFVQDGRDRRLKIRRLGVEPTTTLKMLAIRQAVILPGLSEGGLCKSGHFGLRMIVSVALGRWHTVYVPALPHTGAS